jgi:hypothetical protein
MGSVLSAGAGRKEYASALKRDRNSPGYGEDAGRMLEAEASDGFLGRQVFWLSALDAPNRLPAVW